MSIVGWLEGTTWKVSARQKAHMMANPDCYRMFYQKAKIVSVDFEYLNTFFHDYKSEKTVSSVEDFSIHNIRNDFFMMVKTKELAFVVGGNRMDFFTPFERLDDASLRELSNDWMLYFLNYHLKRNLIKGPMCENHPLMYTKK